MIVVPKKESKIVGMNGQPMGEAKLPKAAEEAKKKLSERKELTLEEFEVVQHDMANITVDQEGNVCLMLIEQVVDEDSVPIDIICKMVVLDIEKARTIKAGMTKAIIQIDREITKARKELKKEKKKQRRLEKQKEGEKPQQ